ncbi:MAG TPA: CDP-alcohol phosphatidyltransferase family protein [Minicystis sp.]|nr:CDP-alcohol phosphatidyltransferase family protein [Minicystis sp.]
MPAAVAYEKTLKPGQVETALDLAFFRPVAYGLVRLALPTPLTANGMTALSIAAGLAGAVLLRFDTPQATLAAAGLMIAYGVLDCADGQLARARGTSSRLGRILDGASDYVVGVASGATIALRLADAMGPAGAWLAAGGLASILVQGTLFDHFKNRYLSRSGASYREGDDLDETLAAIEQLRREHAGAVPIALHRVYATFLRVQRALGGGAGGAREGAFDAAAYKERLAPIARGWAYLGPSTHVVLLAAFACAGQLPAYVWLRLTAGNAAMLGLFLEQRRRERDVAQH